MKALDVKLWRDLKRLRAQVFTIAMVVACGVAGFVGAFSTHASLERSRDAYYAESRFADVFASVRRAPRALQARLEAIDGVAEVKLDTAFDTQIDIEGVRMPLTGRLIGLALDRPQGLNALTLRTGRLPERAAELEAVVTERFAKRRGLRPGSTLHALLNGRREQVRIVGIVLSPEYVYATRGNGMDDEGFGVLWLDRDRLAAAFDMDGAFNRAALRLHAGARPAAVVAAVDRLLEPWGAVGAVPREDQASNAIVADEMRQQQVLGSVLPGIFLAVAAFVLHVVMSRQIATQRQQIAALKALGYRDAAIAWHYVKLALATGAVGVAIGLALSRLLGEGMLAMYADFFAFAALDYRPVPAVIGASVLAVMAAAALGAFGAIRAVLSLSPAQAMLPPAPPTFAPTWLDRWRGAARLSTAARMVVRNIQRQRLRALFTVVGIACAVALQISGSFWSDAVAAIMDMQFRQVQRADVLVDFTDPLPTSALPALRRLPGVIDAEGWRTEPVRVAANGRTVDTALTGHAPGARLMRVVDESHGALAMPAEGVMVSGLLARELGVGPGDTLDLEFRLWHRRRATVRVDAVVQMMFGKQLYMALDAMNRLAGDGEGISHAALHVDPLAGDDFQAAVKSAPRIAAVFDKASSLRSFEEVTATNLLFFTGVLTAFAVAMAVGITYNAARIALSERAWELASLRVLGMTRAEVSMLLLAELGLELLLALPLGSVLGYGLAWALMQAMQSDNIDFPVVIEPATYATAALCVLAAGIASALVVRRQIDRLDLVSVLKVRE